MIMKRRQLVFSVLFLVPLLGSLQAQPTAPTPERNAAIQAELAEARPMAADLGDGTIPTGNFDLGSAVFLDISSREQSRTFFRTIYNASEGVPMEWTGDYNTGDSGNTSPAYKEAILRRINYTRAMAGVPDGVTFNSTFSAKSQDAALMMSANNQLNHFPPTSWTFWTADGREAAENSNLAIGSAGPDSVNGYMEDHGANNAAVGHRRWLLYPQTEVMGTGDVPGIDGVSNRRPANSIWVFDGNFGGVRPDTRESFVAWPPAGHVPYQLVHPRWSIAVAGADFNGATVSMTRKVGDGSPASIPVSLESVSTGVGEPTLVWVYDGLSANDPQTHVRPAEDTTYAVSVQIVGQSQPINYEVVVFDPDMAGADFEEPVTAGSVNPVVGVDNTYSADVGQLTDQFQWRSFEISPQALVTEDGENGDTDLIIGQSHSYGTFVQNAGVSGSTALYMNHSTVSQSETIELKGTYLASSGSQLEFSSRRLAVTSSETTAAQVSLDDGNSWITVWELSADALEGNYTTINVPLSGYAGKTLQFRMLFSIGFGSWYPTGGWYVDNIEVSNVREISSVTTSGQMTGGTYAFNPARAATFGLQVRGVFYDSIPLDWGPTSIVTAEPGSGVAPNITSQPTGGILIEGESISLTVEATGDPKPTFQWKKDGVDVPAATSSVLDLTDVTMDDAGSYTVVVSNLMGSDTSDEAVVLVNVVSPPVILGQPQDREVPLGGSVTLSVNATGTSPLQYAWTKVGDPTVIGDEAMLNLFDVTADVVGGYRVEVSNGAGSITSRDAVVTLATVVSILSQPEAVVVESGGSATFTVAVDIVNAVTFQWYRNGEAIDGATWSTLRIGSIGPEQAGDYTVGVTGVAGTVTSEAATLSVSTSVYGGAYFGQTTGDSGDVALWVDGTNQAVFVFFRRAESDGVLERNVTIGPDGSFSFAGPQDFGNISGQISGDDLTGSFSGISLDFSGTRSDPDGLATAYDGAYPLAVVMESGSDLVAIAGGDGRVMIYAPGDADTDADALVTSINASGQVSGTSQGGVVVDLQFRDESVSGSFNDGTETGNFGGYRYGVEPPHLLANISMRGNVGTGSGIMIAGFVINGGGNKPILVRAVGPRLDDFGVGGAIRDPQLLVSLLGGADIGENDNWGDYADQSGLIASQTRVGAFAMDTSVEDSALVLNLVENAFTARVSGVNNGTGISLVEVYDADDLGQGGIATRLSNISMRGLVSTGGGIMIPGFVIHAGSGGDMGVPKRLLIRAVGPTLGSFGVSDTISDPNLELYDSQGGLISVNDNWEEVDDLSTLTTAMGQVGAFSLEAGSKDSALLISLLPGVYTAQVSGIDGATGVALVEVYAVP